MNKRRVAIKPTIRDRVAYKLCQFANGRDGCNCVSDHGTPRCEATLAFADLVIKIVKGKEK